MAFLTTAVDPSLAFRMTLYRPPHYGYRFFAGAHYDVLPYVVILNGGKKVLWEKRESGTVTQSEESMTLMTFYGFPHHGNRSFACRFRMTLYRCPHYGYRFFAGTPDGVWRVYRNRKSLVGKTGNGAVSLSEESITRMTLGDPFLNTGSY